LEGAGRVDSGEAGEVTVRAPGGSPAARPKPCPTPRELKRLSQITGDKIAGATAKYRYENL